MDTRGRCSAAVVAALVGLGVPCAQAAAPLRVGVVFNSVPANELAQATPTAPTALALIDGLRERGWVPGRDVELIWKTAEQRHERLPQLIDELLRKHVDVIVVSGDPAAEEAFARTRTVPIVMTSSATPVERGLVRSLARPGTNVTGLTSTLGRGLAGKRLSLLKQAAPSVNRVGVLVPSGAGGIREETRQAAIAQRVEVVALVVDTIADLAPAFERARRERVNGLLVEGWSFVYARDNQLAIAELTRRHRLPAIHAALPAADAGALLAYGSNEIAAYRRSAHFVDRILRGTSPAQIPVEQPLGYELHVNLVAARAIGLAIPASLLIQADRVIE